MLIKPIYCRLDLLHWSEGGGHERRRDLPVALAVDADLWARLIGLDNGHPGVASGYQIYGRSVPLPHEVEGPLLVLSVGDHILHIAERRKDLPANSIIHVRGLFVH